MEQLFIPRPFGTEGASLAIRFDGYHWTVTLTEWTGERWFVYDRQVARSSDGALAEGILMLAMYRDELSEPLDDVF